MLNAASLVGEVVPGYFTKYIGVPMMMIISCGICAVLVFCMLAVKTAAAVGSFSVLYGLFSGACMLRLIHSPCPYIYYTIVSSLLW